MNSKIFVVARTELDMLVRTKAFLITLLLMPILVVGSIVIQMFVAKQVDRTPRKFALVDRTGKLFPAVAQAVGLHNALAGSGALLEAPFTIEDVAPAQGSPEEQALALSERVRSGELFAFVDIPANIMDDGGGSPVRYSSDRPTYEDLRTWVTGAVSVAARDMKLQRFGLSPDIMRYLEANVKSTHLGLVERGPDGQILAPTHVDVVTTTFVPLALMYILFLTIFMSAPQLMNAVMQEKLTRISEVLLGSVTPFELMMGKLLGSAGMSSIIAVAYLAGGAVTAARWGYGDILTAKLVIFFVVFMLLAVLIYGSIFIAVGAACNDLKDAQSLIAPVMLIAVVPMFAWPAILKSPSSPFSFAASIFPTAAPFLMQLRLALHPGPPLWQVLLSVLSCILATLLCVWAAGKIFRVGILAQGKSASFGQLIKWVRAK